MAGLLDQAPETVLVFPSVEHDDGQNVTRVPSTTSVEVVGVFMIPTQGPESNADGQAAPAQYTMVGRVPLIEGFDGQAEVQWSPSTGGPTMRFSVVGRPQRTTFPPALAHTTAQLRER